MAPPGRVRFAKSKDAIGRELDIARARKEFFPGRSDVSDQRAFNKQQAVDQYQRFKNQFTRPTGVEGLVQMTPDAPMNLAEKRMELSNKFGPTLADIGSDFRFGIGRFFDDLRAKGPPVVQAIKGVGQGFLDFLNRPAPQNQMVGTVRQTFDPMLLAQINQGTSEMDQVNSLNDNQRDLYNMLRKDRALSHAEAFATASNYFQMANGGIATLQ